MTVQRERYADARAVEMAIQSAARGAHDADPTRSIGDVIRQAHYDRFLCRVFSQGDDSQWVIKGGTGMLARIPNARRTRDVDLYRTGYDRDLALDELRRLAAVDLGDFFSFAYRDHRAILTDDLQPYADGYRVSFAAYLGPKELETIKVDLSGYETGISSPTVADPANRLALPKLTGFPYRIYPVSQQVADKVCATLAEYRGKPSSREKDLVDLVAISLTQSLEAGALRRAIQHECRKRHLPLPSRFTIPPAWGRNYTERKKNTPSAPYDIAAAQALMDRFLGPILNGTATGHWNSTSQTWETQHR